MLLKNEIPSATAPKTLELKIDQNDAAIVRDVTIPYWKDIQYGPISWTSNTNGQYQADFSGTSMTLDYDLDGNKSTLTKEPAAVSFISIPLI